MIISELCDDILELIGEEVKKQPRYKLNWVFRDIPEYQLVRRLRYGRYDNAKDALDRGVLEKSMCWLYDDWRVWSGDGWVQNEYKRVWRECGDLGFRQPITNEPYPKRYITDKNSDEREIYFYNWWRDDYYISYDDFRGDYQEEYDNI